MALTKKDIIKLLETEGSNPDALFKQSHEIKSNNCTNTTWLRGLIEYSNICSKDCLYCGIRKSNGLVKRYVLSEEDVLSATKYAYESGFGSIVIQAGEVCSEKHIKRIESLLPKIKQLSNNELGITLSLGEQSRDACLRWFEAGADRYLLRIETSSKDLYARIHPAGYSLERRIEALRDLRDIGYQVGTGVMIGLPFQTIENLADDLLFMRDMDIDMCGMGPYIEHRDTPLFEFKGTLKPVSWRLDMTLKMIAVLRMLMPDINIAATTALQAISSYARDKAIYAGANVVMPNITPMECREHYNLYENKPVCDDLSKKTNDLGLFSQGNSLHFKKRTRK